MLVSLTGGYGTDTAIYTGSQGDYTFATNVNGSLTAGMQMWRMMKPGHWPPDRIKQR